MKKWIVAALLVLAVVMVAPWGVGVLTEQQWAQAEAQMNAQQEMLAMDTRTYERSYFGADVAGVLRIQDPSSGDMVDVPYQGEVSHGLLSSQIDLQLGDPGSELMQQLFPEDQPSISTTVNAWGTADIVFTVPAIDARDEETGESLKAFELIGRLVIADKGGSFELDVDWQGMVALGPDAGFTVNNLLLHQSMERLRGDVWTGTGTIEIDTVTARLEGQPELSLQGLSLDSTTRAGEGGDSFSTDTAIEIGQATSAAGESGPYRARFAMEELDVDAWNGLLAAFAELQMLNAASSQEQSQQQLMEQQMQAIDSLNASLRRLAAGGFAIGFPEVGLTFPEGRVTGELMLRHPELSQQEAEDMALVMERLTGNLDLRLPAELVSSQPALLNQMAPLIEQGLITPDGEDYVLDAELENLQLDVNGTLIPLPPMI
ncbi:DUF945 family protein [Marinobacter salicampi]|uniref:DUF945 family protein n=1 Tax=Marinobacter salicampi TaxID=435907 RepID=UPI0014097404|nr:DUF945 family protein [Marinobacter salicampi]